MKVFSDSENNIIHFAE